MENFAVGDTVSVYTKELGEEKPSSKIFTGVVIGIKGRGSNRTFTVRKIGAGKIGIERIFPLNSPSVVKIKVRKKAKRVRRAKLYYLRSPRKKKPASKRLL